MARRKKTSPLEDFIELVALMPWWIGIVLAVVSYVLLHRLAQPVAIGALKPGEMAGVAVRSVTTGLAGIGQYLVPFICVAGAVLSAWRRRQRGKLVNQVAQAKSADALDGMSWSEFELLVGEAFRLQGFKVAETGGGGADGGVDLVLTRGGEKFLVQCKQWKAYRVGVDVVRELYGVMAARGAAGGFVVTSGNFTDDAREFAEGRNLKLVGGEKLFGLIRQAKASVGTQVWSDRSRAAAAGSTQATSAKAEASSGHGPAPACPTCGSAMVKRTARKGANAGNTFWGCSTFPRCRGVAAVE